MKSQNLTEILMNTFFSQILAREARREKFGPFWLFSERKHSKNGSKIVQNGAQNPPKNLTELLMNTFFLRNLTEILMNTFFSPRFWPDLDLKGGVINSNSLVQQ